MSATWVGRAGKHLGWIAVAVATLAIGCLAHAAQSLDIDQELRLLRDGKASVHIQGARYRFAVFTYEDPDDTGLGNALATLVSHELLINGQVDSRGVLRYLGGLGGAADEARRRYFDKVEPLIDSQGVQIAIWGVVRRTEAGIQIDSCIQLSPATMQDAFGFRFRLPHESGPVPLIHRIGPDRMLVQRLHLPAGAEATLRSAAAALTQLRPVPSETVPASGNLPIGSVYVLLERRGDWLRVGMASGRTGWVRGSGVCSGSCQPLLEVAGFAGGLMAYGDRGVVPTITDSLAADARVVVEQLRAVARLNDDIYGGAAAAMDAMKPWCAIAAGSGLRASAGSAAACNLMLLAEVIGYSRRRGAPLYNQGDDAAFVNSVVRRLAEASLDDPRHQPTLENLATLFGLLGDRQRAALAARLARGGVASAP